MPWTDHGYTIDVNREGAFCIKEDDGKLTFSTLTDAKKHAAAMAESARLILELPCVSSDGREVVLKRVNLSNGDFVTEPPLEGRSYSGPLRALYPDTQMLRALVTQKVDLEAQLAAVNKRLLPFEVRRAGSGRQKPGAEALARAAWEKAHAAAQVAEAS